MAFSKGDIAAPFIQVKEDENGVLQDIKFVNDDNFNFAYDVVDKMAKKDPDKVAMLHISKDGKERSFTFYDMARYSSKVANYLQFLGIKKGDRVMLVLKRHYQFWFAVLALHKLAICCEKTGRTAEAYAALERAEAVETAEQRSEAVEKMLGRRGDLHRQLLRPGGGISQPVLPGAPGGAGQVHLLAGREPSPGAHPEP